MTESKMYIRPLGMAACNALVPINGEGGLNAMIDLLFHDKAGMQAGILNKVNDDLAKFPDHTAVVGIGDGTVPLMCFYGVIVNDVPYDDQPDTSADDFYTGLHDKMKSFGDSVLQIDHAPMIEPDEGLSSNIRRVDAMDTIVRVALNFCESLQKSDDAQLDVSRLALAIGKELIPGTRMLDMMEKSFEDIDG